MPRAARIDAVLREFERWITTGELLALIRIFGGDTAPLETGTTVQKLRWLKTFVPVWDYRAKQAAARTAEGEAARWLLENDALIAAHEDLIYAAARRLGMIGITRTLYADADYVLPLGGARLANLRRCEGARDTVRQLRSPAAVVALTGMRPINASERAGYVDTYAPEAVTEFDAVCAGMRIAFGIGDRYEDTVTESENPNLSSTVRRFAQRCDGSDLYAIAAPSSDPGRRANSADCFHFFFRQFAVPAHAKLVSCTSQIYCPYQQVRALAFAMEYGVQMDTIGFPFPPDPDGKPWSEPVQYLQEIKGTIDAMNDFVTRFVPED